MDTALMRPFFVVPFPEGERHDAHEPDALLQSRLGIATHKSRLVRARVPEDSWLVNALAECGTGSRADLRFSSEWRTTRPPIGFLRAPHSLPL